MRSPLLPALSSTSVVSEDEPLLELLHGLQARDYDFTVVTPATHARVLARPIEGSPTLRDIFGWNRPFAPAEIDRGLLDCLRAADMVETLDSRLRSKVRVASLDGMLFLHSSFPTDSRDSVFFGPDTYRFGRFIRQQLPTLRHDFGRVVDMGAGSGAGGIMVGRARRWAVTLVDVNPAALRLAAINAAHAGVAVELVEDHVMPAAAELVIANPPYMMDPANRAYRDGGGLLGGGLAYDWLLQALGSMRPGGTMLLYSGAAFERGESALFQALRSACMRQGAGLVIEELDPDVFGDELDGQGYERVERIAAIGAVITKARH
jgi:methylase of polypeptide subunit release factors